MNVEAIMENAVELMRHDLRVRVLVDGSVSAARDELGRYIDPERADEEACDLARRACAILASRIFTEDAELHFLRMERDHYKKLAENALTLTPGPWIVPAHGIAQGIVTEGQDAVERLGERSE